MSRTQSSGAAPAGTNGGGGPASAAPPHPKTVAEVLGEIVWLMSQSPAHKHSFIADLEWMVMPPVLLSQFRLFHGAAPAQPGALPPATGTSGPTAVGGAVAQGQPLVGKQEQRPIGVAFWAMVDAETESRLAAGGARLRPQDWRADMSATGRLWVVEVIAPFGGAEAMVADLKKAAFSAPPFAGRPLKYRGLVDGQPVVREVV
jgi:cytolysin-activating lysine-acyltransferase